MKLKITNVSLLHRLLDLHPEGVELINTSGKVYQILPIGTSSRTGGYLFQDKEKTLHSDTINNLVLMSGIEKDIDLGKLFLKNENSIEHKKILVTEPMKKLMDKEGSLGFLNITSNLLSTDNMLSHIKLKDGTHVFERELSAKNEDGVDGAPQYVLLKFSSRDTLKTLDYQKKISEMDIDIITKSTYSILDFDAHESFDFRHELPAIEYRKNSIYGITFFKDTDVRLESSEIEYQNFSEDEFTSLVYKTNDSNFVYLDSDYNEIKEEDSYVNNKIELKIKKEDNPLLAQLFRGVSTDDYQMTKSAIDQNIDVNQVDSVFGFSALKYAAINSNEVIFDLLIKAGAKPDESILDITKFNENKEIEVAVNNELLLNEIDDDENGLSMSL